MEFRGDRKRSIQNPYLVRAKSLRKTRDKMFLDEEYDGFSLKVDFNISKKEEVVASLEKVLENLQKDF